MSLVWIYTTYIENNEPLRYFSLIAFLVFLIASIACVPIDGPSVKDKIYKSLWCLAKGISLLVLFSIFFVIIQKQVSPNFDYCSKGLALGIMISILCIPHEQRKILRFLIPFLLRIGENWKDDAFEENVRKSVENSKIEPEKEGQKKDTERRENESEKEGGTNEQ